MENKNKYNHILYDIKLNSKIDLELLNNIFENIVKILDLKVLKKNHHIFDNGGFTLFFLLAESHISGHYRIEDNFLALDLYTCRKIGDKIDLVMKELEKLNMLEYKIKKVDRTI